MVGGGRDRILVIGGGFFGCRLATFAKERLGFREAVVFEESDVLLGRASYYNQARVHTGYHYPRAFTTAYRSRVSREAFSERFAEAIDGSFSKLYAVASSGSKVTAGQFARFCDAVGAPYAPASRLERDLFDPRFVEAVFRVEETAFDAVKLAEIARRDMVSAGVETRFRSRARFDPSSVSSSGRLRLSVEDLSDGSVSIEEGDAVLNCAYGRLTSVGVPVSAEIRYEITEIALVEPPPELASIGVTVMDGPFFSCMPFPPRGLHSLSHVRYTPHVNWTSSESSVDPYEALRRYARPSLTDLMIRDAARLLPCVSRCVPRDEHFEMKAVLVAREDDDGRPILFEPWAGDRRVISVLGGKIDNVADAEAAMADLFGLSGSF
jgi:glycine/D-amino acid oxidase-like deaminating enzyme